MSVFIDLQKYKNDPIKFFDNIAWKSKIDDSLFVDFTNKKKIPLKDAPEWVMNNLYLLDIPIINVGNENSGKITKYKNVKPIEILQQQKDLGMYVQGWVKKTNEYYPKYRLPFEIKFQ